MKSKIKMIFNSLLTFGLLVSCNKQEPKLPLGHTDNKELQIISKILEDSNYQLDQNQFDKRNLELLGISELNKEDNDYEEIMIQKDETDYRISAKGKFIKIGQDMLPDLDRLEKTLSTDHKTEPYFNDIINLNKLLYKDDPSTIPYLIKNADLGIDAVVLFNYEKNKILYNRVLNKIKSIDDYPDYFKLSLVFYNNKDEIRKNLLDDLMVKSPTLIDEMIIYMYTHYELLIKKGFLPQKINKGIAYLLEISLEKNDSTLNLDDNKSYSLLNNFCTQNKKVLNDFQKDDYYGYSYLKKYSELFNSNKDADKPLIYLVNDPDGYTNLRKDKNTSSEILQKVKSGDEVEVLNNSDDWWQVKTKEGKEGFIHKSRMILKEH